MTNPKLALIPSGYKGGTNPTVYSILPSDGSGDFTFDRANGYASRVREDGLIEEVSNDTPRLDYLDGGCPSLLLEPSRTNLITYSENFSQWNLLSGGTGVNPVVTSDSTISPDGTQNADKIVFNSGSGTTSGDSSQINNIVSVTSGTDATASIYLKGENGGEELVFRGVADGSYQKITLTTEWQRFSTTENSGTTTDPITFGIRQNVSGLGVINSSATIYAWGGQVEVGSYATSYIKSNSGSTTTRLKDECINAGDNDLFDITEGTFFVDANNFGTPYLDFSMITLSDGSSNFVRFIYESSRIRTSVENGSIQQDYFITGVNDNERNKVAITFKENEFKVYHNGVLKDTDPSGVVPTNLDRLNFANQSGTSRHFEGKVYDTRVYDRVLTEAEAIELTTL